MIPPPVPVTVTVAAPSVAVLDAVNVSVLVVVVDAGLNAAVTPAGRPVALKTMLLLKPPVGATVMVLLAVDPWLIARLAGLAVRVKLGGGGATTVRVIEVVCDRVPLIPVMVTVPVPTVAVADAVNMSVLVPVVDVGLNVGVTPAGRPLALKATLPVNPPLGVTVIVVDAVVPRVTVTFAGLAESEKSGVGGAFTVSVIAVVCESVPLVQVMVTFAAPRVAVPEAARVSTVLFPAAGMVAGLKFGVTPIGKPVPVQVTAPANPPTLVMVTVLLPLAPVLIDKLAGLADTEKSGTGGAALRSP